MIHIVLRSEEEPISEESVSRAFRNGLRQAEQWQVEILATPPLGIGAGNLDAEVSARVMCSILREHAKRFPYPKEVVIAVANAYEEEAFLGELARGPRPEEDRGARGHAVEPASEEEAAGSFETWIDAPYNNLWRPTEPIFQAFKHEYLTIVTISKGYREPTCFRTDRNPRGN
ncbi:MAG: hypothetical protein EXR92_00260 [Gemmatimonadetes bacterium]|nr:hypothetical protein [Gemmatimonadota bacterium]